MRGKQPHHHLWVLYACFTYPFRGFDITIHQTHLPNFYILINIFQNIITSLYHIFVLFYHSQEVIHVSIIGLALLVIIYINVSRIEVIPITLTQNRRN